MLDGPCSSRPQIRELAIAAKVSIGTVARFRRGDELKERTVDAIYRVLEVAGIDFIDENGRGPAVRQKRRGRALVSGKLSNAIRNCSLCPMENCTFGFMLRR